MEVAEEEGRGGLGCSVAGVATDFPSARGEDATGELERLILEFGCDRVVPAIEETEHRDRGDDAGDLAFVEVFAQLGEVFVGCGVWNRRGVEREGERSALGVVEVFACLPEPRSANFSSGTPRLCAEAAV